MYIITIYVNYFNRMLIRDRDAELLRALSRGASWRFDVSTVVGRIVVIIIRAYNLCVLLCPPFKSDILILLLILLRCCAGGLQI